MWSKKLGYFSVFLSHLHSIITKQKIIIENNHKVWYGKIKQKRMLMELRSMRYEGFMFYIMKLVECFIAFKFHSYPSCLQWYFNLL